MIKLKFYRKIQKIGKKSETTILNTFVERP